MDMNARPEIIEAGKLIVVLGMHRSGTSATTRALMALGADLGERLLKPLAGVNDKGFFEDVDILTINIELLAAAGVDWHTVGSVDLSRIDPLKFDQLRLRAVSAVRAKCKGRIFALKDPRLSRLMPFWEPVFESAGVDVRYVIAVRNPISVAQSLAKRDRFGEEKSYLLWLAHVVPALTSTRGKVRTLVDYDRLLDDPKNQLRRMASQLGLSVDGEQLETFGSDFVDEGLRHTRFTVQDVNAIRSAPSAVKRLFAELDEACRTGEQADGFEACVEAGEHFLADLDPLLRYEVRVQRFAEQQNAAIKLRDQQITALVDLVSKRDQRIVELEQEAASGRNHPLVQQPKPAASNVRVASLSGIVPAAPGGAPAAVASAVAASKASERRPIFSFIVDADPKFAYEGYHLARSLIEHSCDRASDVHVQFTPEVGKEIRRLFGDLGCTLHEIQRFGDGRYCNKLAQLGNLHDFDCTHAVLLDTDMIAVDDLRPHLKDDALTAKMVDFPNPPVEVLAEIAQLAGLQVLPMLVPADGSNQQTYLANCNGGFYGIPKALMRRVDDEWRKWALWLLDHIEPLAKCGKAHHVDQVAMWLAKWLGNIPFRAAPANVNYFLHFDGMHQYFDDSAGIALLHYHDASLNVVGKIEPKAQLDERARAAVAKANDQIGRGFENTTFWNFRYSRFPERGSGVGSRGENMLYKRELLVQNGIESRPSVLDVGCGDLEMLKELTIQNYLGIDSSREALQLGRRTRPDWEFIHTDDLASRKPAARDMVLCFEVLIHQPTEEAYRKLVEFLAGSTSGTLLVSGYEEDYRGRKSNSMVHFYEPLSASLKKTGKFSSIRPIGAHSDVVVLRCDV